MKIRWPWSKRVQLETLLRTDVNKVGSYQTVDDWQDVTVQVASASADRRFNGTVTIEGTLDKAAATALWFSLLVSRNEEILRLSGFSLAGLRATTSGMTAGEVVVLVSGR